MRKGILAIEQSLKAGGWIAVAILLTILSVLAHEVAHYAAAIALGAQDVQLRWADVTYDPATLNTMGIALFSFAGPLVTHAIILTVWISGTRNIAALALGLGAVSRDLVILPYTIKILRDGDLSTFTSDEARVAGVLNISPLPLALLAVGLGLGGLIVILTRAARKNGWLCPVALVLGTVAGIALWGVLGPLLLEGGRGYG